MEERFYIDVHLKVSEGWISYARFNIGPDQNFAHSLLDALAGRPLPEGFIRLNLMEDTEGIALVHESMYCTLQELAENSMFITKEVFRFYNLESY